MVLMIALAAEKALVFDELRAELILTQHIQGALHLGADALGRFSQGASIFVSRATRLPVPPRNHAFYKAGGK